MIILIYKEALGNKFRDLCNSVIPKYDILLLRNEFFDIKGTPKSYLDLMIKCWDNSPIKEIINIIEN
ncbi:hypothetical protein GLOIN_2v1782469 [Rhizophagus irregularis DAOM 181602=DAOM 197198]|uniref:Serine-threonine/tyrosine-protein kinase catalytic domain-containing protein n=1 Tax=Rhizophagus irregularis (strain DAOM 181602 / DAOM 197198 / MUCL 43194) TaxID=747089 RepID=A0A2P4PHA2_RHIID|nr:hypothetical protein GLOIN_2v1782469 [Rhizophagus irregularis DAOM 181602=DAOM 197198]POG64774.1 hypothetical protein GLOIN_2v1782469 [Rhizophagus irregularis DAOM 181602=DAOM 197198]GET58352.1 hypothetical protein GLOIN_2v1782469 [Rhizophagus irregularis DAOM 181602=DAOM 197198]|eukprot:XP_025171640.1 hypothetical protein GLOIN_2v1782469 [Rhizophagus irregularis DAOM 181602=DAOM 197198]